MATKRKEAEEQSWYIPFNRHEEVVFVEEGAEEQVPFKATLRTNLTFAELDGLTWEDGADVRQVIWPMFAPYVTAWNVYGADEAGDVAAIAPPAEAGPAQFQYIPIQLFWLIVREVKLRNMGSIDPKRNSRRGSTDVTDGGESSP